MGFYSYLAEFLWKSISTGATGKKGRRTGLPVARSSCVGLTPYDTVPLSVQVSVSLKKFCLFSLFFLFAVARPPVQCSAKPAVGAIGGSSAI